MIIKILLTITLALAIMLVLCIIFYEIGIHIFKKTDSELDGVVNAAAALVVSIAVFGSFTLATWIVFR